MRRLSLILAGGLTAVALAACSGGTAASAPPSTGAASSTAASGAPGGTAACAVAPAGSAATVNVTIKDFKFSPNPIQAKAGDVIAWTNNDTVPHTATLADDSCSTDNIAPGTSGMLVFSAAGTYTYKCKIHTSQMNGYKIEVK